MELGREYWDLENLYPRSISDAVRSHVPQLNATIEPKGRILDSLFAKGIITNDDKYAIGQLPSKEDRADMLMHLLFKTSHPEALHVFKEVLHEITEYKWLACSIDVKIDDTRFYSPPFFSWCVRFSTDDIGMIEKKIQTIEFLLHDESHQLGLRESIYEKLRSRIQRWELLENLRITQPLVEYILEQLDSLYMLGRLLGASWNDYEIKAAKFHCVTKITRPMASAGILVTPAAQRKVDAIVDEVMSIAIADAKADCNSMRYYSRKQNAGTNYGTKGSSTEGNVKLYGVSTEDEHLRAQLVSNRKMFSKNVQTIEFWTNEKSLPSLVSLDLNKLEYWEPLVDELKLKSRSILDDVRKQLEDIYTLCRCLGAAWSDYESSEAEFSFVQSIIQSIDDAGSPITESMQESMTALVKEVMSKAIADAKADWNSTESPGRGQAKENKGTKRKSNAEKGDKIKRKVSLSATNGYCTD